ncbi:recombination regulator RecX [Evansella sp. AB-P1]|uniref:recombination regulator RecX n=1 Tax=Evansella sp. AB-P1 TaxID=3037653 RepID=UPI00241FD532|nr:recombination regulator RecX [Evansella sp. AB-P1]MDG5786233.1 recombination regulator RecX [Evansella sp. AB-P1]
MPQISKISIAKRRKDRFHIYVDRGNGDEYAVTVSEDVLVKRQLSKGVELSEDDLDLIREEDNLDKAFQKVLNYLSYRMRSRKEIFQYLLDQEVQKEDAEQLIDRLKDLNLLDDQAFAEAFVRTKKNTQKKGPLLIEQELYEKGISQQQIDKAILEYPEEEQLDNAIKAITKKQSSYKLEGQKQRKQKLYQFLVQRGFTSSIINKAIDELQQEDDDGAGEWIAIQKQGEKALKKLSKYEGWELNQRLKKNLYQKGFSMELIERWIQEEELE